MQKVLSNELWRTIRVKASRVGRRQAAIAYVTQDLLGFRREDTLIVNASRSAISSGETDAPLLRKLFRKGVRIYDCKSLHAKIILLGDVAIIGSGNMSHSSVNGLIEAGVITDHQTTVSGVASLIEQLRSQSVELSTKQIAKLCRIKVIRGGRLVPGGSKRHKPRISRLGNKTWLLGVREDSEEPKPAEQKKIDEATDVLRKKTGDHDFDPDWIRWAATSKFGRNCKEGDSVIQIWRSNNAKKPTCVYRSTPILLRQTARHWVRGYLRQPAGSYNEMRWGKFKRLIKELGYGRRVGSRSEILLDADMADAINRRWTAAAKS